MPCFALLMVIDFFAPSGDVLVFEVPVLVEVLVLVGAEVEDFLGAVVVKRGCAGWTGFVMEGFFLCTFWAGGGAVFVVDGCGCEFVGAKRSELRSRRCKTCNVNHTAWFFGGC